MSDDGAPVTASPAVAIGHAEDFAMLERCIAHHKRLGVGHFFVSADAAAVRGQDGLACSLRITTCASSIARKTRKDFVCSRGAVGGRGMGSSGLDSADRLGRVLHVATRRSATHGRSGECGLVQLPRFNVPLLRLAGSGVREIDLGAAGRIRDRAARSPWISGIYRKRCRRRGSCPRSRPELIVRPSVIKTSDRRT